MKWLNKQDVVIKLERCVDNIERKILVVAVNGEERKKIITEIVDKILVLSDRDKSSNYDFALGNSRYGTRILFSTHGSTIDCLTINELDRNEKYDEIFASKKINVSSLAPLYQMTKEANTDG